MPTPHTPFTHALVPYDGSEPARAALMLAIALAKRGAALTVATIVDEATVIAQSASATTAYDPTPLMDVLDDQGLALLDDAVAQCRTAKVVPGLDMVHDTPVDGILSAVVKHACDLVIMGTHARTGIARTFLGSTTEGVLRASQVPVLTMRTVDRIDTAPFTMALVAVDDSEPADAALAVAAMLARRSETQIVACHAIDTDRLYQNAAAYGLAPELIAEMRVKGTALVQRALAHASLASDTPVAIIEGDPAIAVIVAAAERHATVIVVGTHGRRGLSRFFLGSVAEGIVRTSDIPVLVVRGKIPAFPKERRC